MNSKSENKKKKNITLGFHSPQLGFLPSHSPYVPTLRHNSSSSASRSGAASSTGLEDMKNHQQKTSKHLGKNKKNTRTTAIGEAQKGMKNHKKTPSSPPKSLINLLLKANTSCSLYRLPEEPRAPRQFLYVLIVHIRTDKSVDHTPR